MRTVWIAAILFIVVLAGSTAMFFYSSKVYEEVQESLNRLYEQVKEENWEEADQETANLVEFWSKADASWTPIMDHRQVDRVDEAITRVVQLVDNRMKESLLVEIPVTRRLLKRLKDTEVPNLQNVL